MHVSTILGFVSMAGVCTAATASAQDVDPEVTIRLIPDAAIELPASVDTLLALPDVAASVAVEASQDGLARANDNRTRRRDRASERAGERRRAAAGAAADARVREAGVAVEIAEATHAARETFVRGKAAVALGIPVGVPEPPEHVPSRARLAGPPAAPAGGP